MPFDDELVDAVLHEIQARAASGLSAAIAALNTPQPELPDPPPYVMAMIGMAEPRAIVQAYLSWLDREHAAP